MRSENHPMFDFEIPTNQDPAMRSSLDERRPRKLSEIVGQAHIVTRISQAAKNGCLGRRYAFIGPTGCGKTTLAQATARTFFCPHSRELGDACSECKICSLANLPDHGAYHEWTGAELSENWEWWNENGKAILERSTWCFFLDEAQDLSPLHQKALFRQLETARAMVIFATTHEHLVNDALLGRFGANKFEVRRPTRIQAVDCMERHCQQLGVVATRDQLMAVARHYAENLRLCVDFVFTIKDQTTDGCVTDEFLKLVIGEETSLAVPEIRARVRL